VAERTLIFTVSPSRFWFGAVIVVAVLAATTLWTWAALQILWPDAVRFALLLLGAVALGLGWSLSQQRTLVLRWDGQVWHCSHVGDVQAFNPGFLTVSLDGGSWMLVCWHSHHEVHRFKKHGLTWAVGGWIPVQRLGFQGDWHAWRCAVFGQVV
jgi:hypothetical protein